MQGTRILLVDDEPACLQATKTLLDVHGYSADTAADAADAFMLLVAALANQRSYDILITDFEMPDTNGIDLFLLLRNSQPDIEGILLTGALTDERRADALQRGMIAAFEKGCDFDTLLLLVECLSQCGEGDAT